MSADLGKELAEVKAKITAVEAKITAVENAVPLDVPRRNRLEEYLVELQKEKNRLAGTTIYKRIFCIYSFRCIVVALVDVGAGGGKELVFDYLKICVRN